MTKNTLDYMSGHTTEYPRKIVVSDRFYDARTKHEMSRHTKKWVDASYDLIGGISEKHDVRTVLDMYQLVNFFADNKQYLHNLCHVICDPRREHIFRMGIANPTAFVDPAKSQILVVRAHPGEKPHFALYNRHTLTHVSSNIYGNYDSLMAWIIPYLKLKAKDFLQFGAYHSWRDAVAEMFDIEQEKQYK